MDSTRLSLPVQVQEWVSPTAPAACGGAMHHRPPSMGSQRPSRRLPAVRPTVGLLGASFCSASPGRGPAHSLYLKSDVRKGGEGGKARRTSLIHMHEVAFSVAWQPEEKGGCQEPRPY